MRYSGVLNIVSIIVCLLAIILIFTKGLNLSNEFTGGTAIEVSYPQAANLAEIRTAVRSFIGSDDFQVQNFGRAQDVIINLPLVKDTTSGELSETLFALLKEKDPEVELKRVEFVGPQVGNELFQDGLLAITFSFVGIVVYLAFRFEWKYGVASVIANMHDVIIILGFFAFFQWEFSLSVLAAVLAALGYSVNESVIIFDRVRENFRTMRSGTVSEIVNNAITRTLSRTMITHGSTEAMVLSMLFFGGPTLYYFALALTIGIAFSIYSSIFVAAPIAIRLGIRREDLIRPPKEKLPNDGAVV